MKSNKVFVIRIDLESHKGIKYGLPKLLDLFKKHNIKGSFYLTMGGESNIFEIIKNRGRVNSSGERSIRLWGIRDKIRMLLHPIDFVEENKNILRRIIRDGHELGLHGWKHREWTRNLNKVNVRKRLDQMISKYVRIFGIRPTSWASPGFNVNKYVLRELSSFGITHISDFDRLMVIEKMINVPITICGKFKTPFIEYFVGRGKSDYEIFDIFKVSVKRKSLVSFYLHAMFEGRFKIDLLEKFITYLKENGYRNKMIIDFKSDTLF